MSVFRRLPDGSTSKTEESFCPFVWLRDKPEEAPPNVDLKRLHGDGDASWLAIFGDSAGVQDYVSDWSKLTVEWIRPFEHQFLLKTGKNYFSQLPFKDIRRLQLDIETGCSEPGGFSDPGRSGDRVLSIGLRLNGENTFLILKEETDQAERELLKEFSKTLAAMDPDIIEGHNIYRFDLNYLKRRCARYRVKCDWGRDGKTATFRPSRMRIAERMVDFPRCDIPGRSIFDTYLMIQLWDITQRELPSYGLKAIALHLGISAEAERTYIPGNEIHEVWKKDRKRFVGYLGDDLYETEKVADLLLPTYVAQAQQIPMTLQEICLRGTAQKVESLLLPAYLQKLEALPAPPGATTFAGGYTVGTKKGVFQGVLHFDIASLYPSLLLLIGRNPAGDSLGCFLETLSHLRTERLRYKKLAKEESDTNRAADFNARQASFKILINSFYGYLGFGNARFGDSKLAAEVTAKGREILKSLIDAFESLGCPVLEADTDGIYVHAPDAMDAPEELLEKAAKDLPEGIDLELGGQYEAMFCYKAKNYALLQEGRTILRGSALRSRGMEPFLRQLTETLVDYLLGVSNENPGSLIEEWQQEILEGRFAVERLAKRENLSMSPTAYKRAVEEKNKPRRASMEVALKMDEPPGSGDPVTYFIRPREQGEPNSDWARAVSLEVYDPITTPYDPKYYLKKLREWGRRYAEFLENP